MSTARVLPGFGLSLGFTLVYLSLVVLIPLSAVFISAAGISGADLLNLIQSPRVQASFFLSFGASLIAALVNVFFGLLLAWSLAGIALTTLYASNGWIGHILEPWGLKVAYTRVGVTLALIFIGLPFVVRTVQPVLADLEIELEEAATALGAQRWQTIWYVILPVLFPALLTGFALAFARAVGEYGSVIFIAGNIPLKTEIAPLLIVSHLEEYDYVGATVIAAIMLIISFILLFFINVLQNWASKKTGRTAVS
jgi:sulfate transport system permease protein